MAADSAPNPRPRERVALQYTGALAMCPTPTLWILWLHLILHFYKQVHEEHLCHALMVLAQSSLTTNSQQRNYWVKICAHFKAIVAGGGTQGLRCSTAELHPHINTFRLIMLKSGLPSH